MSNMAESQSGESSDERNEEHVQSEEESSENESNDESSDDSDGGGLLDTMAAVDSEEDSDESDDENHGDDTIDDSDTDLFPKFSELPTELRHRVWEFFCPELFARYRVLDFIISYGTARHPESASAFVWTVRDGMALEDQTRNLRTVFAVHQESRALATNAFPHTLSIDAGSGDALVAFNRNSDVVLVNGLSCPAGRNVFHLPEFASEIKNLALGGTDIIDSLSGPDVPNLLSQFSQLESFYVSVSSTECQKSSLTWCTSDLVNHYQTQTYEKQPGLGEDLQFLWCWPDLQRHPDFARFQISRDTWDNLPDPLGSTLEQRGLKAWPMVAFEYERGLRRYEMLQTLGPDVDDSESSEESDGEDEDGDGPDLDQYESDGIDDDEIVETYDDSDEEGISLASGSPAPAPHQVHELSDDEDEDGAGANFSSPEPDPEPESAPVPRGRKRRVVSDSDDESEEDVQPSKRARTDRVDESEDEDDEPQVSQPDRSQRSRRAIVSDDDDDDDEQGGVSRQEPASDDGKSDSSGSEDSEDEESEESEEEDAPPARLSLAERLRLNREENPVDNGDSDDDDRSSRTAGQDSEDEDEDQERNPFMMGMADESDGEGEGDEYEDDY
ncbi:hypothetical protein ACHAPJ_011562 [Fusarium lateritium]